ncbi:MAG: hypothetical protein ACOZIN_11190 [Myxococcota bacterium]
MNLIRLTTVVSIVALAACAPSPEAEGLRLTDEGVGARVKFDLYARPLPEIPIPNDFATRYDPTSPTKRRINASQVADTEWERVVRKDLDQLDGWGTFSAISVGFEKPLDVEVIFERHRDDYDFSNDAVYVLNITPDSPDFCQAVPLDMGEGNFPLTIERPDKYYPNDPRGHLSQIVFDEVEEDKNGNGVLDLGEDTDMDGVLDHPNLRFKDGNPRTDLLTFYERETNTLLLRPLMPMREGTTYAAVLTKRLRDEDGHVVRSPFKYINYTAQTEALSPLPECLGKYGLSIDDVSFTWSFTTQSITHPLRVVRDGLYGLGPMAYLERDFPPEELRLHKVRSQGGDNLTIVPGEDFVALAKTLLPQLNKGKIEPEVLEMIDSYKFVGFHAVGSFESPQFFPRTDAEGNMLPLYEQVWKLDPLTGEAFVRPERVTFWLTVPRPEYSRRPAPLVIVSHGYTSNNLEMVIYAGYFARHGIATISIDCVSHGLELDDTDTQIARAVFKGHNLEPMIDALMAYPRAHDWNRDGRPDSASDFWTAYVFHTRDVVRQSAVDYMRLVRLIQTFDGARRWRFDVDKDGTPELAGDFDGDGLVDIGAGASMAVTGGSLGGIMSSVLSGIEPKIDVGVPVAGGGGLTDVGIRSIQGGVAEAVNLRTFGPLMLTLPDTEGKLELWQYIPEREKLGKMKVQPFDVPLQGGDTAVLKNLKTGDYRCGPVLGGGLFRVGVSSDEGDPLQLELYSGTLPPQPRQGCSIPEAAQPSAVINTFSLEVTFQGRTIPAGSPLVAIGDGFGIRRSTPEMRRFMQIAQVILDPADPVNFAPYFEHWHLRLGTGEESGARVVVVNTIGDMNVPVSTGTAIARAAGFIDFQHPDPRWGKTPNRVLIDTGVLEATEVTNRYINSSGESVLMDVDYLAAVGTGVDGFDVPRLDPPLRLVSHSNRAGGFSGVLFPFPRPTGKHGFDSPDSSDPFNLGGFMLNLLGRYATSKGREFSFDPCHIDSSCAWVPPVPAE